MAEPVEGKGKKNPRWNNEGDILWITASSIIEWPSLWSTFPLSWVCIRTAAEWMVLFYSRNEWVALKKEQKTKQTRKKGFGSQLLKATNERRFSPPPPPFGSNGFIERWNLNERRCREKEDLSVSCSFARRIFNICAIRLRGRSDPA